MMTARLLLRLEKAVPGWLKKVDLFAGASTGAIIALALAKGLTPAQIATFYRVQLPKIFSQPWWRKISGLFYAKYSGEPLKAALNNILGQTTLGQLDRDVLIATYYLGQKEPFERSRAKFYDRRDANIRIADLARWSGSAPTYLPSAEGHVDGGLSANNCTVAAMAYQESRGTPLSDLRVFSLGTGAYPTLLEGGDKGLAYWGEKLLIPFIDGSVDVAHFQAHHFLKDEGTYFRLQPELQRAIGLDEVSALDELIGLADRVDIGPAVEWLSKQVGRTTS
jgi:predicted acylesterase/phospholipase RssA